jgi:hypothetical protein
MRLTREQRIARACKILGPKADQAAVAEAADFCMSDEKPVRRYRLGGFYSPRTKRERTAAGQLRDALAKVKKLLSECSGCLRADRQWLNELARLQAAADAVAHSALPKPTKADVRKRHAVASAAALMEERGLALAVTRGGKFERLAAVLFGDERADLFHYCATFKRKN